MADLGRVRLLVLALVIGAALTGFGSAEAAGPAALHARIRVDGSPAVQNELITLADIAEIEAASSRLADTLASLVLGRAALPGERRLISLGVLQLRLRQAGIPPESIEIVAETDPIAVRTEAQFLPAEAIERTVREWYEARAALPEGSRLEVRVEAEELTLPAGAWALEVVTAEPKWGRGIVILEITVGGRPYRRVNVWVRAEVEQEVAVFSRSLGKGEALSPGDIRWERRTLERPVALPPLEAAGGERGLRVTRHVRAGTVVTESLLEPIPDLLAGERVTLVAQTGPIWVQTEGEALGEGRVGDLVAARNLRSGMTVYGRIMPDGVVAVEVW